MSVVLRTVRAFPRGRTIEELHALIGTTFRHEERMALLTELEALAEQGSIQRLHNGRWIPRPPSPSASSERSETTTAVHTADETGTIVAAPFTRTTVSSPPPADDQVEEVEKPDLKALLRYWRSALRADPRGAITEAFDRHGAVWHLISGRGTFMPDDGQVGPSPATPRSLSNCWTSLMAKDATPIC